MEDMRWDNAFRVGIEAVDKQHERFFELLDQSAVAMREDWQPRRVVRILDELIDYARSHFEFEARLMAGCAYPDRAAHAQEHDKLLGQLVDLREMHRKDRNLALATMLLLYRWLSRHILTTDRRLGAYLESRGMAERDVRTP